MRETLGPFRIEAKLGEGGMGAVYRAVDVRLGRPVAIKCLHGTADPASRRRLLREAHTAARVNHPRICQIHEVGEEAGEPYLVLELLEGRSLAARLREGPLEPTEALDVALEILEALHALHDQGVVHRDLKPSNVFLTPHGVKLLDFGLALPLDAGGQEGVERLTATGALVGTPGFMAPEQWTGADVGPPCDLFALGALVFEMVTGRAAFAGATPVDIFHAVVYEQPPALSGGAGVIALDRVIQQALAKRPQDRYPSARTLAEALRAVRTDLEGAEITGVHAMSRLLVLPFRLLERDEEIGFLSDGLAESLTSALSGLDALVVRSAHVARRFAGPSPDLRAIASEAEVDAVLLGSLRRRGSRLRTTAELVEVPSGTALWSARLDEEMTDVFAIEDELVRRIVEGLAIPLSARDRRALERQVPARGEAYELFLRANQLSYHTGMLSQARDLYRACLEQDPGYAPAWARLGRVYRILAKYGRGDVAGDRRLAEEAFDRALTLDPDLATAHNLYAYYEIEELGRPEAAMTRLLGQVRRHPADPELYAGLVVACRFCGLYAASAAAHARARRLDPGLRTSVAYTYFMAGDYERALQHDDEDMRYVRHPALPLLGREAECVASCRELESRGLTGLELHFVRSIRAAAEGDRETALDSVRAVFDSAFPDPEGLFLLSRCAVHAGGLELGESIISRVVDRGFSCLAPLRDDPWLAPLRGTPAWTDWLARLETDARDAQAAYEAADGVALLGAPPGHVARRTETGGSR